MRKLNRQGFTLIEVVVVMAIIAVLAVLVVGAITIARNTAKETTHRSNAKAIQTGLEAFYARNKNYTLTSPGATLESVGTALTTAGIPVDLQDSGVCTDTTYNRGGTVAFSTTAGDNAYTIRVANSGCNAVIDDAILGPVN